MINSLKSILNLVSTCFIGIYCLLLSSSVQAESFQVEQLPFSFTGEWQVCVQAENKAQLNCTTNQVPSNIETSFADFDGFIHYRAQFTILKSLSDQALGIYIKNLRDSDEVYINGTMIAKTGEFKPDFEKATLYSRYYFVPNNLLKTNTTNTIEIKVFNHARYGGMVTQAPLLDTAESTAYNLMKKNGSIMLYMGIFFIIFVMQIFYYFAQKTHKEHLYFALFSICTVIHLYTFSNYPIAAGSDLNFIFKLNIFLYATLTILFCLFINKFFHHSLNLLLKITIGVLAVSAIVQAFFLPLDLVYYQVMLINLISLFVLAPFYVWLFYRSIQQKIPYAKTMAFVSLLHISAALVDILTDMQVLPPFFSGVAGLITPITLMILFITISLILTHRHWLYYRHATYDYLTDALRRSAFMERLSEEIPRSQRLKQPLMVALLDIDNFKQINDKHSHIAGDEVLVEVVKRVRSQLREFDLLARYGGDEFCIAASVSDTSDAMSLLKRVKQSIDQEPIHISSEQKVMASITIGAYVADPNSDFHPEMLISEADKILIEGKVNQKGKIHI
ncbi:MAG: diguanylate cyclase [Gammaproteobacteria bacterium]|nr:diguanylate cyclase [Gammaproteobacteria bacterium]